MLIKIKKVKNDEENCGTHVLFLPLMWPKLKSHSTIHLNWSSLATYSRR